MLEFGAIVYMVGGRLMLCWEDLFLIMHYNLIVFMF